LHDCAVAPHAQAVVKDQKAEISVLKEVGYLGGLGVGGWGG